MTTAKRPVVKASPRMTPRNGPALPAARVVREEREWQAGFANPIERKAWEALEIRAATAVALAKAGLTPAEGGKARLGGTIAEEVEAGVLSIQAAIEAARG